MSEKRKFSDLPVWLRGVIIGGVTVDLGLRVAALADLSQRPQRKVNGSKKAWAMGLSLVSSVGILPSVYFCKGRKD